MRQLITPNIVANEIMMRRQTFPGAFLLVEGCTDERLMRRLIDEVTCAIKECLNRDFAMKVVALLDSAGFSGHLAIVDDDFGSALGEKIASPNIVTTGINDVEVMIFDSDAFDRIVSEYANPDKVRATEASCGASLRQAILIASRDLGALRYLSRLKGWNLKFHDMTIRFIDGTIQIDVFRQIQHLRGRSPNPSAMPSDSEVHEQIQKVHGTFSNPAQMVCGHDLCEVIARGIRRVFGRADVSLGDGGAAVAEVLRAAYTRASFELTSLFGAITAWEKRNPGFKILPP